MWSKSIISLAQVKMGKCVIFLTENAEVLTDSPSFQKYMVFFAIFLGNGPTQNLSLSSKYSDPNLPDQQFYAQPLTTTKFRLF